MKTERHYDFHVGNEVFESGTHVMAILNATPDSFYAGSRHAHDAVETAKNSWSRVPKLSISAVSPLAPARKA